jgi:hypothetical protein
MTSNWFPLQRHASVQGLIVAGTGLEIRPGTWVSQATVRVA